VWKDGFKHGGQNKVAIETAYIPHARVFVPLTRCKKTNDKKITLDILGMVSKPINLFH
jgi:hypothetical protein